MSNTIVIQRCVPFYRVPIFEETYRRYGWKVVAAANFPEQAGFNIQREPTEWLHLTDFKFPEPNRQYRADVPVDKILAEHKPDHVIAEMSLQMSSTWSLPRHKKSHSGKLIFWGHGLNLNRGFGLRAWPSQLGRIVCALRADANITYSDRGSKYLRRVPGMPPVFTVRNGLGVREADLPLLQTEADVPVTGQTAKPTYKLLTISRLTPEKNLNCLVEAVQIARKTLPNLKLEIIGDGPERGRLEQAGGSFVEFAGPLYDMEPISERMREADLAVFSGGVGLSANHALQEGLPVVAFKRGRGGPGHGPEIDHVEEQRTGWLVQDYSAEALAHKLTEIYASHPSPKAALRDSVREYVREHLTFERMLKDLDAVEHFMTS